MSVVQRQQCLYLVALLAVSVSLAHAGNISRIAANSNQAPAGKLQNAVLTVQLEADVGNWYPEDDDGPGFQSAAFRETGGALSAPGPLIRVPEGTEIRATIHNRLDQPLTIHGLHSRPG